MNELNNLLTRYPLQELILLIFMLLLAGEGAWKLFDFYWNKHQVHVGKKIDAQKFETKLAETLTSMDKKIDELGEQNKETHIKQGQMDSTLTLVQERMQENSRSDLIDAHHKFCYQYKKIDDLSLQSIERKYLYYKTAGGDTFIDHLMEEVRTLPRVSYFSEEAVTTSKKEGV